MSKTPTVSAIFTTPPDIDAHTAEMDKRKADYDAARPILLDCLDPTIAKYHEDRKDLYEWKVETAIFRKAAGNTPAHMEKFSEMVVAHSDKDAWALFCDKIGEWPNRRDSQATITKIKKRTLRGET